MNDQYIEREKIYTGPISSVYKAKDASNGNIVALKIVDPDFLVKPHNITREIGFLKSQASDKDSPRGILSYITSFTYRDDIILVTDYYDVDLDVLLKSYRKKSVKYDWNHPEKNRYVYKNQFPTELADNIFHKLSVALRYLHDDCNIIHRDIKPTNVFFKKCRSGQSEIDLEPVIGDFGILYDKSHPPSDEPTQEKYTDVSTGIYKAPELCLGLTNYDTGIDIWSFGILMSLLYSNDGFACLKHESGSDLSLIDSIFQHFGTPYAQEQQPAEGSNKVDDPRRYWPEMKGKSQFELFKFNDYDRMGLDELIPRCKDEKLRGVWDCMMVYESDKRYSARDVSELTATTT